MQINLPLKHLKKIICLLFLCIVPYTASYMPAQTVHDNTVLPERIYIQVRFDLHDTQGGLYNSNYGHGVSLLEYQYDGGSGELIKGVGYNYPEGYWFPYGFIVKYGGGQGASNERIAKYDSGIDYYVRHENLWTTPRTSGQSTMTVYFVFAFQTGAHYDRNNMDLTIPWDEYDPARHTDKALFYIEVNDKNWSVTFDGFEARKPTDNPARITSNTHSGGIAGYNTGTITSCYSTGAIGGDSHTGGITGRNAGTLERCYYLAGTAAGGNDGNDMAAQAEAYTPEQLASGEITWQLQHAMASPAWGQTIGTDSYPLWQDASNKVYRLHLQDRETADNRYGNNGTVTLYAVWTAKKCIVTLNVADGCQHMGSVLGNGIYDYGTEADIKAAANDGYMFVQWSDGDTNARRTISVTEDITLTATFALENTTALGTTASHLFRISGTDGMLHILGTEAPAVVYDTRGSIVYCGTARNIQLPAGIYIVRVADQVQKAVVK